MTDWQFFMLSMNIFGAAGLAAGNEHDKRCCLFLAAVWFAMAIADKVWLGCDL